MEHSLNIETGLAKVDYPGAQTQITPNRVDRVDVKLFKTRIVVISTQRKDRLIHSQMWFNRLAEPVKKSAR